MKPGIKKNKTRRKKSRQAHYPYRVVWLISIVTALAGCGYLIFPENVPWAHVDTASGQSDRFVALDIGHTRAHPGVMSARGVPEFDFNRHLAMVTNGVLKGLSYRTLVINDDGLIGQLPDRVRDTEGMDMFLSIHHDSVQEHYLSNWKINGISHAYSDRYKGFSVFISHLNPFPAASLRCASAIGKALRASGFTPSKHHAEPIAGENKAYADEINGVHYYDNLVVLKKAHCPAVLLEAGVIVNRDEETKLTQTRTQQAIAQAIAEGLNVCLGDR